MSQTPKLRPPPQTAGSRAGTGQGAVEPRAAVGGDRPVPPFSRRHLLYLLGFTMLAGLLRLWDLGTWGFWVDEAHTYRDVTSSLDEFWATSTSRYPVSFLLLRYLADWLQLQPADLSEKFMRLPFAFFGIASVPALAIVARGMIGRRSALLAALFLALSPWHIYWSQNARSYSLVLFLTVIATGAVFYGFQRRSRLQLAYAIVLFFLAGLSHPSAFAVVAAALIYLLAGMIGRRETRNRFGGKWAPLLLLAVFCVMIAVSLPILRKAWEVKRAEFSLLHLIQTLVYYVGIPMLVAAVGGILVLFDRGQKSATFLTLMVVLPLMGLSVLSAGGMHTVSAQYAFAVLPAIHMLAAVLVISLASVFAGRGLRSLTLRLVPLAMVVMHMLGQDYLYFEKEHGWRPRWNEAVRWIKTQAQLNGGKQLHVLTSNQPSVKYYFDSARYGMVTPRRPLIESIERWEGSLGNDPEGYLREVIQAARDYDRDLWVVVTEPELWEKDTDKRADTFLREHLRQVRRLPNWTGPKDMVILIYHLR